MQFFFAITEKDRHLLPRIEKKKLTVARQQIRSRFEAFSEAWRQTDAVRLLEWVVLPSCINFKWCITLA